MILREDLINIKWGKTKQLSHTCHLNLFIKKYIKQGKKQEAEKFTLNRASEKNFWKVFQNNNLLLRQTQQTQNLPAGSVILQYFGNSL